MQFCHFEANVHSSKEAPHLPSTLNNFTTNFNFPLKGDRMLGLGWCIRAAHLYHENPAPAVPTKSLVHNLQHVFQTLNSRCLRGCPWYSFLTFTQSRSLTEPLFFFYSFQRQCFSPRRLCQAQARVQGCEG